MISPTEGARGVPVPNVLLTAAGFREAVVGSLTAEFAIDYRIKGILFFVWRGASMARITFVTSDAPENYIAFQILACYLACVPALQSLRLGYVAESLTLQRSILERVAVAGLLSVQPEKTISHRGGKDLKDEGIRWAKARFGVEFGILYGALSKVVHPFFDGLMVHLATEDQVARKYMGELDQSGGRSLTQLAYDVLLHVLKLLDRIALPTMGTNTFRPCPLDIDTEAANLNEEELVNYGIWAFYPQVSRNLRLIERYGYDAVVAMSEDEMAEKARNL